MSGLPAQNAIYLGLNLNWKSMSKWIAKKYSSANIDRGIRKAWEEIFKGYQNLNIGSIVTAYPMRTIEQGLLRSESITEVDDPRRFRELGRRSDELSNNSNQQRIIEQTTEKYGDHAVDVVRYKLPIQVNGNNVLVGLELGNFFSQLETILFGPDGNTQRTVCLTDRIVSITGGSKARSAAAVRRTVLSTKGSVTVEPYVTKMREKLHQQANVLVMIDPGRIAAVGMQAWNAYMEMAAGMVAGLVAGPLANANVGDDQIAGDQATDEPLDAKPATDDKEEKSTPDDVSIDDREMKAEINGGIDQELKEVLASTFKPNDIEAMYEEPTLAGFSLSMEPNCCRFRLVIPVDALRQLVKAGTIALNRLPISVEASNIAPDGDDEKMPDDDDEESE
jgi:hypothetical protein